MIKLQNLVPKVYYNHSRDFQFIGRLYDIVLNSVKTNTDLIYSLPLSEDSDTQLLDLMTMTFGFQSKHNYNIQQLKALCSSLAKVIRNKGNIQAIQDACNALVGAEGIKEIISVDATSKQNTVILYVPQELSDTNLLRDLLYYILPAGLSFKIVKNLKISQESTTTIGTTYVVRKNVRSSSSTSIIKNVFSSEDGDVINLNTPFDKAGSIANTTIVQHILPDPNLNNSQNQNNNLNNEGD